MFVAPSASSSSDIGTVVHSCRFRLVLTKSSPLLGRGQSAAALGFFSRFHRRSTRAIRRGFEYTRLSE